MRPAHRWIILYDISNPKRLARISKLMQSYGIRVQYSVFEAYAGNSTISRIREKADAIMEENDSVVFIPACIDDWEKTCRLGTSRKDHEEPGDDLPLFL